MLIQLTDADGIVLAHPSFLPLSELLFLLLLMCEHPQAVPHVALVFQFLFLLQLVFEGFQGGSDVALKFQMLSLKLLVHGGLLGGSDVAQEFQMLSLKLVVHGGLPGDSDAVLLSLPKEWKIAFLSWQSGVRGWTFLVAC